MQVRGGTAAFFCCHHRSVHYNKVIVRIEGGLPLLLSILQDTESVAEQQMCLACLANLSTSKAAPSER